MKPVICAAALCLVALPSIAEPASPRVRSAAFVEMIATRGMECGHLSQWQGLALRALAHEDRKGWSAERMASLKAETARLSAETACDAETLTIWIDASRKGFDVEMLPPYLVAYKTLAEMDAPPRVFTATSLRLDHGPVIAAIDAKLEALAASGSKAEGGKEWPEYIEGTAAAVTKFAGELESEGGDQAAAWLAQSALVIEQWYAEGAE